MSSTDRHFKMPKYIKVALANEVNAHKRGELKRALIDAHVVEKQFKIRRRFVAEKEATAE